MLFTDDDISVADLCSLDAELEGIIDTDGILLDTDNGLIRRAKSDAQQILSRFMSFEGLSPTDLTVRDVNLPFGIPDLKYSYAGFEQIVISGETASSWSALKNWLVNKTLLRVYRAATNKNSDRYSDRYEELNKLIKVEYWPNLKQRGLPLAMNPLSCPGAVMMRAGLFTGSSLALVAGSGTLTVPVEYAITWVGDRYVSPASKFNNESYRSARVNLTMTNGNVAQVSIAGLTPPNGQQPEFTMASCRYSPGVAVGWNVWAGMPGDPIMYRQNIAGVLPLTQATFSLPGNPVFSGEQLDLGQFEDIILEIRTQIIRGD